MATKELLTKPRIHWPIIKIAFEIYHALRPFHHRNEILHISSKRTIVFLAFVLLRWFFFLKRLIHNKAALNRRMSLREKLVLLTAIMGHILMIWAQDATLKHERDSKWDSGRDSERKSKSNRKMNQFTNGFIVKAKSQRNGNKKRPQRHSHRGRGDGVCCGVYAINERGPYSIVRHPQHIGKWMSEAFVAVYQSNKVSMVLSVATLALTVRRANREEEGYLRSGRREERRYLRYKRKVPNKLVPGIY